MIGGQIETAFAAQQRSGRSVSAFLGRLPTLRWMNVPSITACINCISQINRMKTRKANDLCGVLVADQNYFPRCIVATLLCGEVIGSEQLFTVKSWL